MKTQFLGQEINVRRIGVLTGGGDCAGLNAVLAGLLRRVHQANLGLSPDERMEVVGLLDGWKSLMDDSEKEKDTVERILTLQDVRDSFRESGTIIYTSRTNIYSKSNLEKGIPACVFGNIKKLNLDCLCVIGGDDTLGAAQKLMVQFSFPVLGAPKTIDNDLHGTDRTFGFESAYCEAARQIINLHATAKSHKRVFVIEVMGRHAGWIALYAGIAAGAGVTLLPEEKVNLQKVAEQARKIIKCWGYGIIVVAEGVKLFGADPNFNSRHKEILNQVCANPKNIVIKVRIEKPAQYDEFGNPQLGGVGEIITSALEVLTPEIEYRFHNCGHSIRSVAYPSDIVLGLRIGNALFMYIKEGRFGVYPTVQGNEIISCPLTVARGGRVVDPVSNQDLFDFRNAIDCYGP